MKCILRIAALAALILPAMAQDVTGDWQGTLKAGGAELHLRLHFAKTAMAASPEPWTAWTRAPTASPSHRFR